MPTGQIVAFGSRPRPLCPVRRCRLILPGSNAVMSMWSSGPDAWRAGDADDICRLCFCFCRSLSEREREREREREGGTVKERAQRVRDTVG